MRETNLQSNPRSVARSAFALAVAVLVLALTGTGPAPAGDSNDQPASPELPAAPEGAAEALAPLAPFVGKTWRGELAGSDPDRPMVDVSRWEWALNGKAIRTVHSINDGAYGGESLIFQDPEGEGLVSFYFTTGGFYTRGTIEVLGPGRFVARDEVIGNEDGVTRVRATSELLPDGRFRVVAEHFKDGEWVPGNERTYVEAPDAEVVFRNPE
ncbi:MAG: hypothetical protein ACLF0P_17995 [Thermoanaerobaculia bacterium]